MSSTRKRWISAEVDPRLIVQLEREASARGISRSEAVRRALQKWTQEAMEEDEERITRSQVNHRQIMNRLDYVIGMIREQESRAQRNDTPVGRGVEPEPEAEPEREGGALAEARKRARRF